LRRIEELEKKRYLTTNELAIYFQVTPETIRSWRRKRDLPYIQLSEGKRLFDLRDVESWLNSLKKKGYVKDEAMN